MTEIINTEDLEAGRCQTISVPKAGRLLGLGRDGSYEAAKRGEIPTIKFGRKLVVPVAALERMLRGEAAA